MIAVQLAGAASSAGVGCGPPLRPGIPSATAPSSPRTVSSICAARYGQDRRNLWFLLLRADGGMTGVLSRIDDVPEAPERRILRNVIDLCKRSLRDIDRGGSVSFLLTRPGWAMPHATDMDWAAQLAAEARARRLTVRPTFLAAANGVVILRPSNAINDAAA